MQYHLYLATITAIYRIQQEKQDAIGAHAWESENLLTFFGTARKPLSKFDNRLILKEYQDLTWTFIIQLSKEEWLASWLLSRDRFI